HVAAFRRLKPAKKSPARPRVGASASVEASSGARTYEVRGGDTLGAIAGRFGVPLGVLVQVNQIADANRINVGQVLVIPGAEPPPPPVIVPSAPPEDVVDEQPREGHAYVVRPGDTLGVIAQRAGTTVAALAEANGIENVNLIFPGQVIFTSQPVA